jgi:hypothetical protein
LEQQSATPETLVPLLLDVVEKPAMREKMQAALAQWHAPHAAEQIAEAMLAPAGAGEGYRADSQPAATTASRTADTGNSPTSSGSPRASRLQNNASGRYQGVLHSERAA